MPASNANIEPLRVADMGASMRPWHVGCGLGAVVTITCAVAVREHYVQPKGDFLGVERTRHFLGATAIRGATVGMAAVGPPIRFDERWGEVSHSTVRSISPVRTPPPAEPPAAPAPPTPSKPVRVRAQSPEPHEHHAMQRELCAAHGMRREYYHRSNGWLSWRCKK